MTACLSKSQPGYWVYHYIWTAIDWVYPPVCGGCSKFGERWCTSCQNQVVQLNWDLCQKCGKPEPGGKLCPSCQLVKPPFVAIRSWGRYSGSLREAILRLKYKKDIGIAEALSKHLIELLNILKWSIDIITVVPLGPKRMQERGYNQSGLLAWPLSLATGISYQPGALVRTRETPSQVGLSAYDRHENVKGAFVARTNLIKNKAVLIVDDVTTTGSTITSCSQALVAAGASHVYGLTLARAILDTDISPAPTESVDAGTYPIL
jgi:ComF family protein